MVVELGNIHEGSFGIATSLVDMVKSTGAKVVKFQMHMPSFESTPLEPFRKHFSRQDRTRFDYWQRTGFSLDLWSDLVEYVKGKGLEFLCTPFSVEAAEWLLNRGAVVRWKVGSGDATNFPLIDFLVSTNMPLMISTGLISKGELEILVTRLRRRNHESKTTLMHCVSKYPVAPTDTALHMLSYLKGFGMDIGYSDHSGTILAPIAAMVLGAQVIEVHMTPHRMFFGPDTSASLLPKEISELVTFSSQIETVLSDTRTKDDLYGEVKETASVFRRGLYWRENIDKGTLITQKHIISLKPLTGVDAIEIDKFVGRRVAHDVKARDPLSPMDFSQLKNSHASKEF